MLNGYDLPCCFLDPFVHYSKAATSKFLKDLVVTGNSLIRHVV